jgi:N-formylglutamate deformylase
MTEWLAVVRGPAPLVLTIPHAGLRIPEDLSCPPDARLAHNDTDWHIDRLYTFAHRLGATIIRTDIARAVIDVNRDPKGADLYPGQATTELCPLTTFAGESLYHACDAPNPAAIFDRTTDYFVPFHAAVVNETKRLRAEYRNVVIYDAHSIRSIIPRLFDGQLPAFNIGTAGGVSCAPSLTDAVSAVCHRTLQETVVDGRFKGGWITRQHGDPASGVHAIQMELAQRLYLDESTIPPQWNAAAADHLQFVLSEILTTCINHVKGLA